MEKSFRMELAGRSLIVETGKMAKQASGAVLVRYGETVVLVTSTASKEAREGMDFFPLTVDYEEKMYAVGKMPGGFLRREGRPGNSAILNARLIDRPIRPLFDKRCRNDIHVMATVLSVDYDNAPELCGMLGASASLGISDIPWDGPIAGVRVGCVDGKFVINPTQEQLKVSTLNITVAGSETAILMVEGGAQEAPEEDVLDAIMFGHETIKELVAFQKKIIEEVGKPKRTLIFPEIPEEIKTAIYAYAERPLKEAIFNPDKLTREAHMEEVRKEAEAHFKEIYPENGSDIAECLNHLTKEIVRHMISVDKIRPDGRALDEIRPISCEVGLLPRVHGSALFTRGQTQALTITTLAPMSETQIIDDLTQETEKRYIHQYNFPSYSVGETKSSRGPGRREIGHGALAERALIPVIPTVEEFPYAIRVVSEILESNGSSSQASVCGSTMSLMNAGVPIKAPVAGIAMGLVNEGEHFTVLTDIQGMEDALGDMDFKVAGTAKGITAIQMDIKIHGLSREILLAALQQAQKGRMFILGKMAECIDKPAEHLSPYAPKIITLTIPVDRIRDVIGSGGKIINKIISETGVKMDVEEDGHVYIATPDEEAAQRAKKWVEELTHEVQVGETYLGKVTRLMKFGVFVEILPGKEGMVHVSQLATRRVEKPEDVVHEGDEIMVKVTEIDDKGRINLSRKALLQEKK
ncbi:polyribonucleotide nucleotidyltransferase [Dialister invisus DSM 15470]|mgnify:FL=1|jgi:polyribonucleotide nucleotidyltransferase|uniref:Polyribonucleotide nucleotidyltransferase n=3 Tax=Dialister invisus TaxID=218538 RepID=C9LR51_9FIRM|nr:polyribonucleotide nucleotidyltransferase [Dialister invisus]EEW96380.1 polyribonucleotide nucleotidyltransferase [Dialister invisus DSM 15470]